MKLTPRLQWLLYEQWETKSDPVWSDVWQIIADQAAYRADPNEFADFGVTSFDPLGRPCYSQLTEEQRALVTFATVPSSFTDMRAISHGVFRRLHFDDPAQLALSLSVGARIAWLGHQMPWQFRSR